MTRRRLSPLLFMHFLILALPSLLSAIEDLQYDQADGSGVEAALRAVHAVSSNARGTLCITRAWLSLPVRLDARRYSGARSQARLAAAVLAPLGPAPPQDILDAVAHGLARTTPGALGARALVLEGQGADTSVLRAAFAPEPEPELDLLSPWWQSIQGVNRSQGEDEKVGAGAVEDGSVEIGGAEVGRWSAPYYSCRAARWLLSYTVLLPGPTADSASSLVSLDLDVSGLELNQCDASPPAPGPAAAVPEPLDVFRGTHKCSNFTTKCSPRSGKRWSRGAYVCRCRDGFYSPTHPLGFNGSLVEVAWQERSSEVNGSLGAGGGGWDALRCLPCAEGCATCKGPQPCRASYNWPFRGVLLGISSWCAGGTILLAGFLHRHRRARVFRSASPIFLAITLLGCAIMYLEMAAIFPVLDIYSCIATKWCRHLGFCITYTALLMKTWRVSLTYRVKSAHAVKLTERQLLRWLLPVLLVMLVFLGTWTLSDPPHAEDISDSEGLKFKQCTYNWWDHSLALGEITFLLWGVRVCYGVRHAESLYNEARLISYAIYNIAAVNLLMVTFHLLLFPQVGPDMKYFLGFVRTQFSTSVTVALVFGPKVVRVCRGFGDQWDSQAARGVSASFSLNGIGSIHPHLPPTPHDLAQENDELKEEVQKLAAQIEFMKIVQMELHNRHLRPRPGGHFTMPAPPVLPAPTQQLQVCEDMDKDAVKPG